MQGYLTITELSKIKKITSETLRHYDRIDLFKPDYTDPDTGYRYYSYAQCSELGTIVALKKLGIPLKDIKVYLEGKSIGTSISMLTDLKKDLIKQISELKEIEGMLDESLTRIDNISNIELMKPVIVHIGKRKVIGSEHYIEKLEDAMYSEMLLESRVNGYNAIVSSEIIGSAISKESFWDSDNCKLKRAPLILCQDDVEYKTASDSTYTELFIEEGDYLCVYGKGRFRYNCKMADFIRSYIKKHKFEVVGSILELDEIDMSVTNNIEEVVYRIEIPINLK